MSPKTKTSLDEQGKEESRNLCEARKFRSIDMELGSKSVDIKKFESRAGKLVKIFELGQKKTHIAVNKCRMGHGKTEPPDKLRP